MGWVALLLASIWAGKCLSFTETLRGVSEVIAVRHGTTGLKPKIYQNGLTPPWLTKLTILSWVTLAGSVIWIWLSGGVLQILAAPIAALTLPAVCQAIVPPRSGSLIYLRCAFHNLAKRSAHYDRAGDHARAAAAKEALAQLLEARPKVAPGSN
jgi:hypothetical protein